MNSTTCSDTKFSMFDGCSLNDAGDCTASTSSFGLIVSLQVLADFSGEGANKDAVVEVFVDASGASPLVPLSARLPAAAVLSLKVQVNP